MISWQSITYGMIKQLRHLERIQTQILDGAVIDYGNLFSMAGVYEVQIEKEYRMMKNRRSILILAATGVLLGGLGCNLATLIGGSGSSGTGEGVETAAAATVEAFNTRAVFETLVAPFTLTPQQPTSSGQFPAATITSVPITATPIPPTPTASQIAVPCNRADFIKDVTIPDGTIFYPEERFTKTWRLQNSGSCTWTPDYTIVFSDGHAMSSLALVTLDETVTPGGNVDISIDLTAPDDPGDHAGEWKLQSNDGVLFGLGSAGEKSFWAKIDVKERPKLDANRPGDFALNYKSARWESSTGVVTCPSLAEDFKNGAVFHSDAPKLEGGYQDDEPAIVLIPSDGSGGMIKGRYPPIRVTVGNDFHALVGCMDNSPDCDVTFELSYRVDGGAETSLGTWQEKSEGNYTDILLDLNALDGKDVEFILTVLNNGSSKDDRVFWLSPQIK
jgi:hypothetical protein